MPFITFYLLFWICTKLLCKFVGNMTQTSHRCLHIAHLNWLRTNKQCTLNCVTCTLKDCAWLLFFFFYSRFYIPIFKVRAHGVFASVSCFTTFSFAHNHLKFIVFVTWLYMYTNENQRCLMILIKSSKSYMKTFFKILFRNNCLAVFGLKQLYSWPYLFVYPHMTS